MAKRISENSGTNSDSGTKQRGKPFPPGVSGNPAGRPRTDAAPVSGLAGLPRNDSWANLLTGVGYANRDKRQSGVHTTPRLSYAELADLYRGNDLAAAVVDKPVDEALRKAMGVRVQEDRDTSEAIDARLDELDAAARLGEAWSWARAFGGSLLRVHVDDGQEDTEPLRENAIKAVTGLTVLDRQEAWPEQWHKDPKSPRFGTPSLYRVNPISLGGFVTTGGLVHASRVIRFDGVRLTRQQAAENNGWGDSVLIRVYEVLRDFGLTWAGAAALLQDFAQAVFEMEGLAEAMSGGHEQLVRDRLAIMDLSRSTLRAIVIAKGENFERKQTPLSGLPEMLQQFMLRLAAAAGQPVSILFGQAPAGLNATGEGDHEAWRNRVVAGQEKDLRPRANRLVKLLLLAKNGPTGGKEPANWRLHFPPLKELDDLQRAELRLKTSQADSLDVTAGILDAAEVAENRYGGDTYSTETQIDGEAREVVAGAEAVTGVPGAAAADVQKTALNGAQSASLAAIVSQVARGEIPRDSGIAMLELAFQIPTSDAERLMGSAGAGFVPTAKAAPGPFGAKADAAAGRVSCVAVFDLAGRMLWGRRKDNGRWTTPCGHVEPGETPEAGALRELLEEAGLAPRGPLVHLGRGQGGRANELGVFAYLAVCEGSPTTDNDPDDELQGWEWIDVSGGLPAAMLAELHVPPEKNILLRLLPALLEPGA